MRNLFLFFDNIGYSSILPFDKLRIFFALQKIKKGSLVTRKKTSAQKLYRNWNEILELRKIYPELALALATCDFETKQGIALHRAFPKYFRTHRCIRKKIPFSYLFYVARKNAHTKIQELVPGEDIPVDSDIVKHLYSHGALDHFNIPYIVFRSELRRNTDKKGPTLPREFLSMKLRPYTVIMYHGKSYTIIEETHDEVIMVNTVYLDNDIPDFFTTKHQLSPL